MKGVNNPAGDDVKGHTQYNERTQIPQN